MVIIHGEQGTGKSTLARIVAKQCGYEAKEVNASDVRSADDLIEVIKQAITTNSHFGKEKKPVCLIIDEVDGAVSGGLGFTKVCEFLKQCTSKRAAPKTTDDTEIEGGPSSPQKKKRESFDLRRPIIFICNDFYAKALRPLRELTISVKISESDHKRLIQRLRQICKLQAVKIEDDIIQLLAEKSNFDARSAINSLQMLCRKFPKDHKIVPSDLTSLTFEVKDAFTDLISVAEFVLWEKV